MPYRKNKKLVHDTEGVLTHKDCPRCHRLLPVIDFNVNRIVADTGYDVSRARGGYGVTGLKAFWKAVGAHG